MIAQLAGADVEFLSRAAERGISAYVESMDPESVQGAIEVAVRRYREASRLNEKVEQLEGALERRGVIERAKGILMERHGVNERDAFELLRDHARASGRRVVEVAQSVLDGHALLPPRALRIDRGRRWEVCAHDRNPHRRPRGGPRVRAVPRARPALDRGDHRGDPGAAGRHPVRWLRAGQPLGRPRQALTQSPGGGRAAASGGRPGPVIEAGDFKRAFQRFQKDEMTQRAAALTYYSLLSLFPALLFGVAVLGFFGQEGLVRDAADYLKTAGAPPATVDAVTSALESAQSERGTALGALVLGLATALYGASGAFGAAGSALNQVWRVQEGRGFVKHKLQNLAWTLVLMVLVLVTCVLVFLGGGLAGDVLGLIGLGDTAAAVWRIARWPAALLSAMLIYAIVYYAAPNVEIRHWKYITPGAVCRRGAVDRSRRRGSSSTCRASRPTRPPTARSPLS